MKREPNQDHVFYRNLRKYYPSVSHGEGIYLYDTDGNRYIDGSGGGADGIRGDHSLLAPPFVITENQIDDLVRILDETIEEVEGSIV